MAICNMIYANAFTERLEGEFTPKNHAALHQPAALFADYTGTTVPCHSLYLMLL